MCACARSARLKESLPSSLRNVKLHTFEESSIELFSLCLPFLQQQNFEEVVTIIGRETADSEQYKIAAQLMITKLKHAHKSLVATGEREKSEEQVCAKRQLASRLVPHSFSPAPAG